MKKNFEFNNYKKEKVKVYPAERMAKKLDEFGCVILDGNLNVLYLSTMTAGQEGHVFKKADVVMDRLKPDFFDKRTGKVTVR